MFPLFFSEQCTIYGAVTLSVLLGTAYTTWQRPQALTSKLPKSQYSSLSERRSSLIHTDVCTKLLLAAANCHCYSKSLSCLFCQMNFLQVWYLVFLFSRISFSYLKADVLEGYIRTLVRKWHCSTWAVNQMFHQMAKFSNPQFELKYSNLFIVSFLCGSV